MLHRTLPLLVLTTLISTGCATGLPDLRPASVLDGVTQAESERARALLERAATLAGGKELLNRHAGFRAQVLDTWDNPLARLLFLKYDARQRLDVRVKNPNVTDVRMTLLNGDKKGEVWGLDANRTYVEKAGKRAYTQDELIMLYIKNPAALALIPLRLAYADKVAYTGAVTHEGKRYETVFATWETFEPNDTFDQWNVWIDAETGLIARAHLTVREVKKGGVKEGALLFKDYKRFGDVLIPTIIGPIRNVRDASPLHTFHITSFAWEDDAVSVR